MTEPLQTVIAEISPSPSRGADGSTPASDLPEVFPSEGAFIGDYFICAVARPIDRVVAAGIVARLSTVREAGSMVNPSTLSGTLTVVTLDQYDENNVPIPLSEPLTIFDYGSDDPPTAGQVKRLNAAPGAGAAEPGECLALVYRETGEMGLDDSHDPVAYDRPKFQILGWPLQTIEPSSF